MSFAHVFNYDKELLFGKRFQLRERALLLFSLKKVVMEFLFGDRKRVTKAVMGYTLQDNLDISIHHYDRWHFAKKHETNIYNCEENYESICEIPLWGKRVHLRCILSWFLGKKLLSVFGRALCILRGYCLFTPSCLCTVARSDFAEQRSRCTLTYI